MLISGFSEDSDNVFDFYYEEPIVALEIYGNCSFGIEKNLIILAQWDIRRVQHLGGNSYDSSRYRGNLDVVRKLYAAFGLLFVLILANKNPLAYRLNNLKRLRLCLLLFLHPKFTIFYKSLFLKFYYMLFLLIFKPQFNLRIFCFFFLQLTFHDRIVCSVKFIEDVSC